VYIGDINEMSNHHTTCRHPPEPVEPIEIPSFMNQFELDEYKDEVGKRYVMVFLLSLSSTVIVLLIAVFIALFWLY
jgi:hypothetical protein